MNCPRTGAGATPPRSGLHAAVGAIGAFSAIVTAPAFALETKVSGQMIFGASYRLEDPAPHLMVTYNAPALGLTGLASSGQNVDDSNYNFRRGDATTRALHAYLELGASEGDFKALLRIKAWHDFALRDHGRPWGNSINGYTEGAPLGDSGAARMARFSGVALSDYYIEHATTLGRMRLSTRVGQQSLTWGERSGFTGGLSALNALDSPALRRAGGVPQEFRAPAPMLFARLQALPGIGIEGFYQTRFQPTVIDLCGTFWSVTDYVSEGCNRTFTGSPPANDRVRLRNGSFLKRIDSPTPTDDAQFGTALTWKSALLDTDFGLYHARYTNRTALPGLRKSSRIGPAMVLNDPDGKNLAFFTEYVGGIDMFALNFMHKRASTALFGELAVRPHTPLQLAAGDVLPAFLNASAPSQVRAEADATAPGGIFHAYDLYRTAQVQLGVQHTWPRVGKVGLSGLAEVVGKYVSGLPDPAKRRYGRADQYGSGPVNGVCTVTTVDAGRQCSFDGYVSSGSVAYRLRVDARFPLPLEAVTGHAWALLTHDVKGWSYDFQNNEGRRSLNAGLRFEYRQRYFGEVVYAPIWGGVYNARVDRDLLSLTVGVRF